MESHLALKVTEEETRQIIQDKIAPVQESLSDIKRAIDKITDYLIQK